MVETNSVAAENMLLLTAARSMDIDAMMAWFPDQESVANWGGPNFRHPFDQESFHQDCRWHDMASYVLKDSEESFLGFGQLYERAGRIHLARISVSPDYRGIGIGRIMLHKLMNEGVRIFQMPEFSLFVLRNNPVAYRLYSSAGFTPSEFPKDAPLKDICYYMTRS